MFDNKVIIKNPISFAMGASVSIAGPENGTYLIMGSRDILESLVRSAGGQIILRLNGRKMLVALPFAGYSALRSNRDISHIGPVTIDTGRLAALIKVMQTKNES